MQADQYAQTVCRSRLAEICSSIGWDAAQVGPMEALFHLMTSYIRKVGSEAVKTAEFYNRSQVTPLDVEETFRRMDISMSQLEDFAHFAKARMTPSERLPKFPKEAESNLNFLKPGSQEVVHRKIHIHDYFPPMYPHLEEENSAAAGSSRDDLEDSPSAAADASSLDMAAASSSRSDSVREISSVMMTAAGLISPVRQGRLPESRATPTSSSSVAMATSAAAWASPAKETDADACKKLSIFQKRPAQLPPTASSSSAPKKKDRSSRSKTKAKPKSKSPKIKLVSAVPAPAPEPEKPLFWPEPVVTVVAAPKVAPVVKKESSSDRKEKKSRDKKSKHKEKVKVPKLVILKEEKKVLSLVDTPSETPSREKRKRKAAEEAAVKSQQQQQQLLHPIITIKEIVEPPPAKKQKERSSRSKSSSASTSSSSSAVVSHTHAPAAVGGNITTQTVGHFVDADGNQVWICPACGKQDDGSPMIGCDGCDDWYHWLCVGIKLEPEPNQQWYCQRCVAKKRI